jgi:hypothetical protein
VNIGDDVKPASFDWHNVVAIAAPRGLERMVVEYAAIISLDGNVPRLVLEFPEPLQPLLDRGIAEVLRTGFIRVFGPSLCLELQYGPAENSIAALRKRAVLEECARLLRALSDSGVLLEMEHVFSATPKLDSVAASSNELT